jgi:hypothetical protein
MSLAPIIYTVCPNCKCPVAMVPGQTNARCREHGLVIPMRSAIANLHTQPARPNRAV